MPFLYKYAQTSLRSAILWFKAGCAIDVFLTLFLATVCGVTDSMATTNTCRRKAIGLARRSTDSPH